MMKKKVASKSNVKGKLPPQLQKEIDKAIKKCYACSRCTSGCPVAQHMDFGPSLMVKWLSLGEIDKVLKSKAIWICSSCQTCYSRCPFEINIPHIIDLLKEYASKNKLAYHERQTRLFHNIFLLNVKYLGRIYEIGLIGAWKAFSGKWFSDLSLGAKMFSKGKLPVLPERVRACREVKKLFKKKYKRSISNIKK